MKITALTLTAFTTLTFLAHADNAPVPPPSPTLATNTVAATTNGTSTNAIAPNAGGEIKKPTPKQAVTASKTAEFGKVTKTDDAYKSALDAHAILDGVKLVGNDGGFKGTVAKVYEPRGLAIVEFDANYRTALTAIVKGTNFSKFPVLTNLIGKDVLVTGKFVKFRDGAEIILDDPKQMKVVQADAK